MAAARRQRGFNLIELMIGIAIFAALMMLAIPMFTQFLANTKIKNAAETTIAGINIARAEAVRRNAAVRFQLVSNLTSGCALSASSLAWVVSVSSAVGACDATPGAATAPQIIQAKSGSEGTDNVSVEATGASEIVFNGLGRVTGAGITNLLFTAPAIGLCEHHDAAGTMRCMRIIISTSGAAKLCDPKVADNTDPRFCS